MTRYFLLIFLLVLVEGHKDSSSSEELPSSAQIKTAADALKTFLVKSLNNAVNTAANETTTEVETDEAKRKSFKEAFFKLFDSVRYNALVSVDKTVHGPNVCNRGELRVLPPTTGLKFQGSAKCQQFSHAIRCFEQILTPDYSNETMRLRRCCDGSETDDILKGSCKPVSSTPSMKDTLAKYKCTATFTPSKRPDTYILVKNSNADLIEVPGVQHVYDWYHGSRLIDKKGGTYIISQNSDNVERVITYLNCLALDVTDITTSEGVAHVCKKKIEPAAKSVGEVLEKKYSEFYKLLSREVRLKLKSNNGEFFTVFVVSDQTIEKYGVKFMERVDSSKKEFSGAHVFSKMSCSYSFGSSTMVSLGGKTIVVESADGKFSIGSAKVTAKLDLVATNGVIHEVDALLDEEYYMLWSDKIAAYNPDFVKMVEEEFSEAKHITVLVPPKDKPVSKTDIKNHVISGESCVDFSFESVVKTHGKSKYFFGKFPQHEPLWNASTYGVEPFNDLKWYQLGCTRINPTPIAGFNSVAYSLEKPLPNTNEDVLDYLKKNSKFSKFLSLFKQFLKHFSPPVGFSLFIPDDTALGKEKPVKDVVSFIMKHMLLEPICDHDLRPGQEEEFRTYSQQKLHMKNKAGKIYVNGAPTLERVELSDAVIFTIDLVLKPSD